MSGPIAGTPILEVRGLTKSFAGDRIRALRGVDLDVLPGESVSIMGRSGSGKTTLLYALCGLIEPDTGTVWVEGIQPADAAAWTALRARKIGIVFQESWLIPTLTALENVELPMVGVEASARRRRERAEDLLASVDVSECADRFPPQLSGGERQRVAIARGIANDPTIVLADEPTGELDTANADRVTDILMRRCSEKGVTLVVVTHEHDFAASCDRLLLLRDGIILPAAEAGSEPDPAAAT